MRDSKDNRQKILGVISENEQADTRVKDAWKNTSPRDRLMIYALAKKMTEDEDQAVVAVGMLAQMSIGILIVDENEHLLEKAK